ncbi:protein NRT1/ PTR FAMILY 1.2 [Ricinus communis]|uniref:Nitrate transporter, putative n=1 Tax=Ricinus communis TaxID=3988 RepID=B9RQI9_RICCO|nr:protein NRT1/ PTR FAMILY 1.2 [Ricinus communis]EEF46428.1 nitrate transporter, putative [Ricinus communis]|eukprot:XP_002516008.1 protein NRT1/ PTR FAMILY 1.2 [Ricinus communis]
MEKNMEEAALAQTEVMASTHQQHTPKSRKGGLITMPFIIANEAFEKVSSYGLLPNMIFYLMKDYGLGVAKGANIIFLWNAATNFMPLLGAFISDSYLGRYLTIGLGSIFSLLGTVLLWLTTMIPQSKPPLCDLMTQNCKSPTAGQITMLLSSMAFISIGAGGIRPCSLAFGADQLDNKSNPKNERILESYFGWYYASTAISVLIALTGIVYIQDHHGWRVGFGVPAILVFLSAFLFFIASPLYLKQKASKSLLAGFAQVLVVAYKNRKIPFPPTNSDSKYHRRKNSEYITPTENIRFLNKACIIRNAEQDLAPDGSASNPWSLCTIEQVEELKALIRVIPIWSTGIMMSINVSQGSFQVLQASSMDRHLSSKFQVPAGSFATFVVISMAIWIVLYDRAILPLATKIKGKPVRLGVKLRMGIGLFLSCMGMVVAGIVENVRRRKAIHEGYLNNPNAVVQMSAFWLAPQYCLNGFAEALNAIGQTEFYYTEFPKSMSSIAGALFGLGMAVANLLATVILSLVNNITSKGGKVGWVPSNINQGHYDNYYWLLAIMSAVNLLYFLICSWGYGPCKEQITKVSDEGNGFKHEEEPCNLGSMIKDEGKGIDGEELSRV